MGYASGRAWSAFGQGLSSIGTLLLQMAEQRRQEQRDEPMRNLQMANAYSQLTGMRAVPDLAGAPFERVNPEALAAATATPYQVPRVEPSAGTRAGGVGLQPEDIMGERNMQPFGIRAESGAPGGLEVGEIPQRPAPTEPLMEPDPSYVQAPGVSGFQFRTPEAERERQIAQLTPAWEDFVNKNPSLMGSVSGGSLAALQASGIDPTRVLSSTASYTRAQRTRWYPQTQEEQLAYDRAKAKLNDDPTSLERHAIDLLNRSVMETQRDLADWTAYRDYYAQDNRLADWSAQRSKLIQNRWESEDQFIRAQRAISDWQSNLLPGYTSPSQPEDPLGGYPGPGNW